MTDTPTVKQSISDLAAHIAREAQKDKVPLPESVKAFEALMKYDASLKKDDGKDEAAPEPKKTTTFEDLRARIRVVEPTQERADD